jgi:ribosomal protein S18 acetylase RimI-like enzyme
VSIQIEGPSAGDSKVCEQILRSLPDWFGIETALLDYSRNVAELPTFTARDDETPVGILTLKEHFPESAEIYVMGVRPEWHRRGVGKSLLSHAEEWLVSEGVQFLQVKTLSESREDEHYAETRAFYRRAGFVPLEEFDELWSEANPCLLMVKSLLLSWKLQVALTEKP